jgi:hypothetical protein
VNAWNEGLGQGMQALPFSHGSLRPPPERLLTPGSSSGGLGLRADGRPGFATRDALGRAPSPVIGPTHRCDSTAWVRSSAAPPHDSLLEGADATPSGAPRA